MSQNAQRDRLTAQLDACVHCGFCLPTCPTYQLGGRESESPRGRIWLIRALATARIEPTGAVLAALDSCLDCRACETACPSGVAYGEILETARERLEPVRGRGALARLLRRLLLHGVLPHRRRLRWAMRALAIYQRSGMQRLVRASGVLALWPALRHWERQQPPAAWQPFTPAQRIESAPLGAGLAAALGSVRLFTGCVMDQALPATHRAAVELLRRAGYHVGVDPGQRCCGALHRHNGAAHAARELARANIAWWESQPQAFVAVDSAGCGAQLREYGSLLADDPQFAERARRFALRVRDVTELLDGVPIAGLERPVVRRVVYDEPCHLLHAQRISEAPRRLLARIPGLTVLPLTGSERCCGAAGIYALTEPVNAAALAARKVEEVRASGAELVVTANPGCLFQLRSALAPHRIEVIHLLELAAKGLVDLPAAASPFGEQRQQLR